MAANRFATKLQKNTNKFTLILVYAVLEWILILLLLLNSLFSYMVTKFAEFFGLKPPCVWCTRIDHMFDSTNGGKNLHLCEIHSKEVSRLGFCQNHQKLVESRGMCGDCLSSSSEFHGSSRNKESGVVFASLNCSCCGVSLDITRFSSHALLNTSSLDVLECALKQNLIAEVGNCADNANHLSDFDDEKDLKDNNGIAFDENDKKLEESGCDSVTKIVGREYAMVLEEKSSLIMKDKSVQVSIGLDPPPEIAPQHLEFFLDYGGHRLVPFELVDLDSMIEEHDEVGENGEVEDGGQNKDEKELVVGSSRSRTDKLDDFHDIDINEEPIYAMLDSMEIDEDENSLIFHSREFCLANEDFQVFPLARWPSQEASLVIDPPTDDVGFDELAQANHEDEADVSIGTEIPDLDITDEIQIQESVDLNYCIHEGPSTSCADVCLAEEYNGNYLLTHAELGTTRGGENEVMVELQSLSVQENEMENKGSDTPTSTDSINEKMLLLEKRDYRTEESLDGSISSDLEGSDGVVTVERLKSALREERKALQVLYAELEEERCASAVAANQTMAMMNRLQEEKAAMQMEALQYQRMMDEQSEYDQEALQLLNELMVKREKEKQELEKELEGYKKKLFDFKTRETMRSSRSSFSTSRCSNAEDSDGLSIDLNQEAKEEEGFYGRNLHTPVDAVIDVEESLADFEEERLSILEQLKFLEEKLSILDDSNEDDENEFVYSNGHTNGSVDGKHRRIAMGKSLLPLFDATSEENEDLLANDSYEMGRKKLGIEEEVDHLYERLQGLEADREFVKHCVSSLRKGDKGMDLLQEILDHLRNLCSIELRIRNCDMNVNVRRR